MFERFNPAARAVIVRAQEQARLLDQNYIGTEHLLLGLLAEDLTTVPATVLRANEVTHARVQDQVLEIVGRGTGAAAGHIPFTPRSKKVLEFSLREALKLRHKYIRPEHVLLGLVREGEGLAVQILVKMGVDLQALRDEVVAQAPPMGRRRVAPFGPGRIMVPKAGMTAGAVRAVDRAVAQAGGGPVGSQHYLLGLLEEEDGLAAKALASLGVTRDVIEAKLAELGTQGTTDEPPERAGAARTTIQVTGDEIAVRVVESDLAARIRSYFEGGKQAAEVPGAEKLWKSLRTALEDMTIQIEKVGGPDWMPPDWGKAGIATFAVVSRPEGLVCQLWTAEGVDADQVRAWLADWFQTKAPAAPAGPNAFLRVGVGRMGDIVPEALEPDAYMLSGFMCGPMGPPAAWPRVPLADMVAAAIANLTGAAPPERR